MWEAEIWLQKRRMEISSAEQQFIEKSLILREKKKKQNKHLFRVIIFSFLIGLASTLSLICAINLYQMIQLKRSISSVEKLLLSNKKSEALLESVEVGKKLRKSFWMEPKITMEVISILTKALASHDSIAGQFSNPLVSVKVSPDGSTIAQAYSDGTIKLWSKDGKQINSFNTYSDIRNINFTPDSNIIASVAPHEIKFWSKDGKELRNFTKSGLAEFSGVSISPDGNIIASYSYNEIILWRKDGKKIKTLNSVYSDNIKFSPDGNIIASMNSDDIILWNKDGKKLRSMAVNDMYSGSDPLFISFSPDNETIISSNNRGQIVMWNKDGKKMQIRQGHDYKVINISFSYDGKTIISADQKGRIIIWDKNLKIIKSFTLDSDTPFSDMEFSPDGNITAYTDNKIKFFKPDGSDEKVLISAEKISLTRIVIDVINVSSNGKFIYSGKGNDKIDKIVILYSNLDELLEEACNRLKLEYNFHGEAYCGDILSK